MKMDLMKKKKKKGFTLIELIVVIAILGILAAIAVPRLTGFIGSSKTGADVATKKTIQTAAMTAYTAGDIALTGTDETLMTIKITGSGTVTKGNGISTTEANCLAVLEKYLGETLPIPQTPSKYFQITYDVNGGAVVSLEN